MDEILSDRGWTVGQEVTTRNRTEASYSNYGGRPIQFFTPGMTGHIASLKIPRVSRKFRPGSHPRVYLDDGPYFVNVDFIGDDGEKWRVGLNYSDLIDKTFPAKSPATAAELFMLPYMDIFRRAIAATNRTTSRGGSDLNINFDGSTWGDLQVNVVGLSRMPVQVAMSYVANQLLEDQKALAQLVADLYVASTQPRTEPDGLNRIRIKVNQVRSKHPVLRDKQHWDAMVVRAHTYLDEEIAREQRAADNV